MPPINMIQVQNREEIPYNIGPFYTKAVFYVWTNLRRVNICSSFGYVSLIYKVALCVKTNFNFSKCVIQDVLRRIHSSSLYMCLSL